MNKQNINYEFKKIEENPIILDLSVCKNLFDIHIMLKQKFGFPEYYGNNWSAFWDCIDDLFEGEQITVEIYGYNSLEGELKKEIEIMLEMLREQENKTLGLNVVVVS